MNLDQTITDAILCQNIEREEQTLSSYACRSSSAVRLEPEKEKIPDHLNFRPPFFHDTDKIIHSNAYTRYMDKTQVFSLFANQHITHRSMHVQYVSKIARTIGRALLLNEDLIEAIALGHDLGHPPFGHDGEQILDNLCREKSIGYFAHNAQSVRTLMHLENSGAGLNISLQVLDGILCHNGEMLQDKYSPAYGKSGTQFRTELDECFSIEGRSSRLVPMTMEGCVVRVSDVIGYIGRDIEDAIHLGVIKRENIPSYAAGILGNTNDSIINTLVVDLLENSFNRDGLYFSEAVFQALHELKEFNYREIYFNPLIKTESRKIRRMFYMLFDVYIKDLESGNEESDIFTYYYLDRQNFYTKGCSKERVVIDFLASMTDEFIINRFNSLFFPRRYGYYVKGG